MDRRLRRCPICKEWFNTTSVVMTDHYNLKHRFALEKALFIAELIIELAIFDAKSRFMPFPESMHNYLAARMTEHQIARVQSTSRRTE